MAGLLHRNWPICRNAQKLPEIPEIFALQRAFRAKTKGSCWLVKPETCSSKCLARACYLKLQKTAKNGRFAVSAAPCAGEPGELKIWPT